MEHLFKRLPTRIVFFVFAVTLTTSLTVAAVSVRSTHEFLRQKVNLEVQSSLASTSSEIDAWYAQRLDEIGVFTASDVLRDVLPRMLTRKGSAKKRQRAEREAGQYLQYLLDDFPQYRGLFVLADGQNEMAFTVGDVPELPGPWLSDLSKTTEARIGHLAHWSNQRVQFASAPILAGDGTRIGTLHALIRTSHLSDLLAAQPTTDSVSIGVIDRDGEVLASSDRNAIGHSFQGTVPAGISGIRVRFEDFETADGESMVGGLRSFPRFDWWLTYEQPYNDAFAPVVSAISRVTFINLAIVVVMCLAAFQIAVSIVRPIEALSDAARRIGEGERSVEIPEQPGSDEVAVLSRVFRDMTRTLTRNAEEIEQGYATIEETNARLQQKNEELLKMNEILEQLSITDGLTKLHNHRHFQEALTGECKRVDRSGEPLALILIDIDEFKKWNDRLGHAGGDEILRKMAKVLTDGIRETDLLARYGGEEFALLCSDTTLIGASNLAEKLRTEIAEAQFFLDPPSERIRVTVSAGVAMYAGDRRRLFTDADEALYRAKDSGRDCVVIAEHAEESNEASDPA